MAEEFEDPQLLAHVAIVELEPGQVLFHPVVPADFSILDQGGERGRGEGLAVGGYGEEGVGIHRILAAQFPDTVAAGMDQLAILHDGDGKPGNPPILARLRNIGIELPKLDIRAAQQAGKDSMSEQQRQGQAHSSHR